MADTKNTTLVSVEEENQISRIMLVWLNTYPNLPVATINFEQLAADNEGMALSTIQGTYKTRRYILGGYEAQYQFKVIYRIKGTSNDKRLKADEMLDALGSWAVSSKLPDLGGNGIARRVDINSRSSLFAAYDGGDEDHQILMTLTYEVI